MAKTTIKELQTQIERRFSESLSDLPHFAGLRPHVSIHYRKNGRKHRENASLDHWYAGSEEIRVSFEPDNGLPRPPVVAKPARAGEETTPDFQPVDIRGEALSNTVLRERR